MPIQTTALEPIIHSATGMASIINHTAFEPFLTGPLLWLFTRASPELRSQILQPLARLPFDIEAHTPTIVTSLKWLFALGIAGRVNSWLTKFALNNWTVNDGGRPWNWPTEICAVTGGSGGIGSLVVQRLAQRGVKVAIMDLSPPPASLKAYRNVHFYECDITDPTAVHRVANQIKSELGTVSILFNNAGIGKTATITEVSPEFLDKIFRINLISHWYTVREFLPDMITAKKGHIVSTASMASFVQVAGMVDYCVTKAGVMSFHEGLVQELKHRYKAPFIKASIIHPNWANTALIKDWVDKSLRKHNPAILNPEDIADAIAGAIFSGRSTQVILPKHLTIASQLRAFSMWFQEIVRDSTRKMTLSVK